MTRLWETSMVVRPPVPARSQMFRLCTLSQIWMQRIHLMHFWASRYRGKVVVQAARWPVGSWVS